MEALGIDLKLLIAQVVNFGILLFVLSKFLYKPVVTMLEERQKKAEQTIKDSDKATKTLIKSEDDADKVREQAYKMPATF